MDEKTRILKILARLWLLLGIIFILEAFFLIFWLIDFLTTAEVNTPNWYPFCTSILLPVIIVLFIFAILCLKKYHSLDIGDISEIKRSFILSLNFLLLFGPPTIYVFSMHQISWSFNILTISLLIFWILTLIIDITIIVFLWRPQVKEYWKALFKTK